MIPGGRLCSASMPVSPEFQRKSEAVKQRERDTRKATSKREPGCAAQQMIEITNAATRGQARAAAGLRRQVPSRLSRLPDGIRLDRLFGATSKAQSARLP